MVDGGLFYFMAKDPAVLFYTSDFISGTYTMTDEQVGKYIRLLCLQHQKNRLSEKDMLYICKSYDVDIWCKFDKDDAGYFNVRMHEESTKRKNYSESRKNNRKPKHMKNISESYVNHMENENENENENIIEVKNEDAVKKKKEPREEIINPFGVSGAKIWDAWKSYKRDEHGKSYKSAKTEQQAINQLYDLSGGNPETALKIVQQSIANQWQGLFELKTIKNANQQPAKSLRESVKEEFKRRYPDSKHTID